MPDDVKSVVANSPTKVTITLTGPTNPGWFTYNQLSQITPFPMAWDISATGQKAGSEACAKAPYAKVIVKTDKKNSKVTPVSPAAKSCEKVFSYLSRQSGFDPEEPQGAEQLAQDVRDESALAGRRRPVAPHPVRLGGQRARWRRTRSTRAR